MVGLRPGDRQPHDQKLITRRSRSPAGGGGHLVDNNELASLLLLLLVVDHLRHDPVRVQELRHLLDVLSFLTVELHHARQLLRQPVAHIYQRAQGLLVLLLAANDAPLLRLFLCL